MTRHGWVGYLGIRAFFFGGYCKVYLGGKGGYLGDWRRIINESLAYKLAGSVRCQGTVLADAMRCNHVHYIACSPSNSRNGRNPLSNQAARFCIVIKRLVDQQTASTSNIQPAVLAQQATNKRPFRGPSIRVYNLRITVQSSTEYQLAPILPPYKFYPRPRLQHS